MVTTRSSDTEEIPVAERLEAYRLLGLTPRATGDEISRAFQAALFEHHADRHGGEERRSEVDRVIWARNVLAAAALRRPTIHAILRQDHVLTRLVPRTEGFLYRPADPVDGRDQLVRVLSCTIEDGWRRMCACSDGKRYEVSFPEGKVPKQRALCLEGEGEPGRNGGQPGSLYLWFP